jgi:serine/threonine protein kinase
MGNDNTKGQQSMRSPKPSKNPPSDIDIQFKRDIDDDRYGEVKIYSTRGISEDFAIKSLTYNTKEAFKRKLVQGQRRLSLDLPTIMRMRKISFQEETDFCSNLYKIYFAYEFIPSTLGHQLIRRKKRRIFFSEPEILHIIDCILSALIYFDSNDILHGDLRPESVFLSKDGIYKLNDIQFMVGLTAYRRF